MQIEITGHQFEVTPALKQLTEEKLNRLIKHANRINRIHVVFEVDNLAHCARATIHLPGTEVVASSRSHDMYKTVDTLVKKLARLLEKHKK